MTEDRHDQMSILACLHMSWRECASARVETPRERDQQLRGPGALLSDSWILSSARWKFSWPMWGDLKRLVFQEVACGSGGMSTRRPEEGVSSGFGHG